MAVEFTLEVKDLTRVGAGADPNAPNGIIMKDLIRRGYAVQRRAKELCPVDTGRLRASIVLEHGMHNNAPIVRVGTNVHYARYVHEGTGIYGPSGARITPKHGTYLVFKPKGSKNLVFAKSVAGQPAVPFLRRAMHEAING